MKYWPQRSASVSPSIAPAQLSIQTPGSKDLPAAADGTIGSSPVGAPDAVVRKRPIPPADDAHRACKKPRTGGESPPPAEMEYADVSNNTAPLDTEQFVRDTSVNPNTFEALLRQHGTGTTLLNLLHKFNDIMLHTDRANLSIPVATQQKLKQELVVYKKHPILLHHYLALNPQLMISTNVVNYAFHLVSDYVTRVGVTRKVRYFDTALIEKLLEPHSSFEAKKRNNMRVSKQSAKFPSNPQSFR